jgi:hypothetical protein
MNGQKTILAIAALLVAALCCSRADEKADPDIQGIAASWQTRQEKAPALRYEMSGKWVIFPPEGGSPIGPPGKTPKTRRIERTLLIDWPSGRFRKETKQETADGFECWLQVFDGSVMKGRPRVLLPNGDPKPDFEEKIGIGQGSHKHATFSVEYWPIFFAAGVVPTRVTQEYFPGHLRFPLDTELLTKQRNERVDGRACTVLRSFPTGEDKRSFEIVVDPGRDGAVVRFTGLIGEKSRFMNLSIRWQQTPFGWQPSEWRNELYRDGAITMYHEIKVSRVDSPTTDKADFDIVPVEKQLVIKSTFVDDEGDKLTDRSAFQQRGGSLVPVEIVDGEVRPKWTWREYSLLALGVVTAFGLLYWLRVRARRSRTV